MRSFLILVINGVVLMLVYFWVLEIVTWIFFLMITHFFMLFSEQDWLSALLHGSQCSWGCEKLSNIWCWKLVQIKVHFAWSCAWWFLALGKSGFSLVTVGGACLFFQIFYKIPFPGEIKFFISRKNCWKTEEKKP